MFSSGIASKVFNSSISNNIKCDLAKKKTIDEKHIIFSFGNIVER